MKVEIEKLGVNSYNTVARDDYGNVIRVEQSGSRYDAAQKKKRWIAEEKHNASMARFFKLSY